ncbi:hypothetical protein BH11MYX2_BH11MYX2_41480 [soil metagenome]
MSDVVRTRWLEFTEPLEGGVAYPYADIRGLITIAYGNLIDPMIAALALPFVRPDGSRATTAEIASAWQAVKNDRDAARRGHTYARTLTLLRLTADGMTSLALGKYDASDAALTRRLPDFASYPACARMALHSLAWACGANVHYPRMFDAVNARDYELAAVEIHMNEWTPEGIHNAGLVPRNKANNILMRNAVRVHAYHLDPDTLDWHALIGVGDAPTEPQLDNPASSPTIHVGSYPLGVDPDDVA